MRSTSCRSSGCFCADMPEPEALACLLQALVSFLLIPSYSFVQSPFTLSLQGTCPKLCAGTELGSWYHITSCFLNRIGLFLTKLLPQCQHPLSYFSNIFCCLGMTDLGPIMHSLLFWFGFGMWKGGICDIACMWRSEDNLQESVFSFLWAQTQLVRLGGELSYLWTISRPHPWSFNKAIPFSEQIRKPELRVGLITMEFCIKQGQARASLLPCSFP